MNQNWLDARVAESAERLAISASVRPARDGSLPVTLATRSNIYTYSVLHCARCIATITQGCSFGYKVA